MAGRKQALAGDHGAAETPTERAIRERLAQSPGNPDGSRDPDFSCVAPGHDPLVRTSRVTDPGVVFERGQWFCSEYCAAADAQAKHATAEGSRGTYQRAKSAGLAR